MKDKNVNSQRWLIMRRKDNTMRIAVSSLLALSIVAAGVSGYQNYRREKKAQQSVENEDSRTEEIGDSSSESEYADVESANADRAKALLPEQDEAKEADTKDQTEETEEAASASALAQAPVKLEFSENSVMNYPVNGQLLLDYSMDGSIYFPTLKVYKYNPAIVLAAEVGTPVKAAATGKITAIQDDAQTGTTVVMDLGNGYNAVYGQLSDLTSIAGTVVKQGEILGYVAEPTKYYTQEGSNLYFAMTKDGKSVDPFLYLETGNEE